VDKLNNLNLLKQATASQGGMSGMHNAQLMDGFYGRSLLNNFSVRASSMRLIMRLASWTSRIFFDSVKQDCTTITMPIAKYARTHQSSGSGRAGASGRSLGAHGEVPWVLCLAAKPDII